MGRESLDAHDLDALLSGTIAPDDAPPGYGGVAAVLEAARRQGMARPAEPDAELLARLAATARSSSQRLPGRRRGSPSRRKVAVALVTAVAATSGLAAADMIPDIGWDRNPYDTPEPRAPGPGPGPGRPAVSPEFLDLPGLLPSPFGLPGAGAPSSSGGNPGAPAGPSPPSPAPSFGPAPAAPVGAASTPRSARGQGQGQQHRAVGRGRPSGTPVGNGRSNRNGPARASRPGEAPGHGNGNGNANANGNGRGRENPGGPQGGQGEIRTARPGEAKRAGPR